MGRMAAWGADVATRVFGPVFVLDASRVGRRLSTFVARWAYLLVLASVLALFFYAWQDEFRSSGRVVPPSLLAQFSESFFWVYAVTQFLVACALTPAFTAAVITDEKERKTLDFLLVTDLTGREIVFGKLASRFGVLLTFVLAGLPVVAFMQFFGGIDPNLLLLATGMTLATVLSVAGIGVAASVLASRTRDAVILAYAVPIGYLYFSPAEAADWFDSPAWRTAIEYLSAGDPFRTGWQLSRTFGWGGTPVVASQYIPFHLVVAGLGFAFAALRLRASANRAASPAAKPRGRIRRAIAWVFGHRSEARQHPPVTDHPMFWREVHVEPGSGVGIIHRLLVLAVLAAVVFPFLNIVTGWLFSREYGYRSEIDAGWYFRERTKIWVCAVTCGLGILMLLRATLRGAAAVAGERDRDTWVSLIATPLSVREILRGKWAGCVLGQRDAMYLLAAVWAVGVLTGSVSVVSLALVAAALGVYLHLFAWLGIRYSTTARNSRVAIARSVPIALFLGGGFWLVFGCCLAGLAIGGGAQQFGKAIGHLVAFVAGVTPVVVLAGLPAIDLEFLRNLRSDKSEFASLVCGAALGCAGWWLLAHTWAGEAHDRFAVEANRQQERNQQPVG